MLGIGAMLHYLGGGSENSANKYYGRTIENAQFDSADNKMVLTFTDCVTIKIYDNGQSCCESRYMVCDDDVSLLNGKILREIIVKEEGGVEPDPEEQYPSESHEAAFLEISTEDGIYVNFATHVEHNGYYGGFGLTIIEDTRE